MIFSDIGGISASARFRQVAERQNNGADQVDYTRRTLMKKMISLLLAMVIAFAFVSACKDKETSGEAGKSDDSPKVNVSKESPDSYFVWVGDDETMIFGLTDEGLEQKSIVIPAKCTSIVPSIFKDADEVETIAFSTDTFSLAELQFYGMDALKTVVLPGKLTTIPEACFSASAIEEIVIPSSVTTIGNDAFRICKNLESIDLSHLSITAVAKGTFMSCKSLESVKLPDTVKVIEENAFHDAITLTDIIFPKGLEEIHKNAFRKCSSLTSVTLPESVVSLGEYAFGYCDAVSEIYLPESLIEISRDAFYKASQSVQVTVYVKEGSYADTASDSYFNITMTKAYY